MTQPYKRDRRFRRFLEAFGEATYHEPVPQASIDKYRGKLPDILLTYWEQEGWNGYDNGLLWTVNPDDYADILADWIAPTPLPEIDDYHVFARTAFGEMYAFGSKYGRTITVNPYLNAIFAEKSWITSVDKEWNETMTQFFGFATKEEYEVYDTHNKPMFQRALKRLGPLGPNEMFGFVPALLLGGEELEKNLEKTNVFIHLDILSSLAENRALPIWRDKI
jgi:hypothetical protein